MSTIEYQARTVRTSAKKDILTKGFHPEGISCIKNDKIEDKSGISEIS